MAMRMTGLASGLDTETIITQLISGQKAKVDTAKGEQEKLKWKKEAWSSLNTKLYSFYTGALSKFKSVGTYKAKKVEASDNTKIKVSTSNNAVTGAHTLSVKQMASSAYLTGASLKGKAFKTTSYVPSENADIQVADLVDNKGNAIDLAGKSFDISYTTTDADGNEQTITKTITAEVGADGTLQSMIDNMNQSLASEGIDMTVSYNAARGGLQFTNNTATEVKDDEGKVTGYEGGMNYTLKATDEDSAKALGISNKGVVVSKQTKDTGDNILTMDNAFNVTSVSDTEAAVTGSTKLTDMGIAEGTTYTLKVGKGDSAKEYTFAIDKNTTLSGLAAQFSKMGVTASYDEKQGRFFVNSTESGADFDFELTADNDAALKTLGLDAASSTKVNASDAIVVYNGATFQQSSNNFSLNGLNFTVNDVTETKNADGTVKDNPIRLTVSTDTDTIYNAVKDFVKEYNALIKEMNTLYNADSAKDYNMLTDEEKDAMSEDDVKEWEDKIKGSLLRRDNTISSLLSTMRSTLNKSVEYTGSDGETKRYSLASFGIVTGKWNEYGQLHINGNADDPEYAAYDDQLRKAIEDNPDALIETLNELGTQLYSSFQNSMKGTSLSSALTFYNDKDLDKKIESYDDKLDKLQERMNKIEDKYYKQFAAMEAAMAEMQANQSSLSGLFGN
ncbi:MAG: flagellar filament capping protein FliD [Lachnospiraceae bacterium]|nr:flagellar filament capping protein FliD [Lachnospiraceae bacterium]